MTQIQLQRHLWRAAEILRGSIDSGDFKLYIFSLLFFKRLSDVWQEEDIQGTEKTGVDFQHRFDIPNGSRWENICERQNDIGASINAAFRAIEAANPPLSGVFQDINFDNKARLSDASLKRLIRHLDSQRLRTSDVATDMFGNAYEYLIGKFADDSGKKGGEFYTPQEVVTLMVGCLGPQAGMTVYDPTCGSGGMLLACHTYMKNREERVTLYGQEKNINTWAICKMNLFLHDIDTHSGQIARGDTLLSPQHLNEDRQPKRFDIVLANPPFSLSPWGHEQWAKGDPHRRDAFGCPPKRFGDFAFLQHMIASLSDEGRMAAIVPHGVLFREGSERKIRQKILEADLVEAVIGLGPNLFYGTAIPAAILLINKNKPENRKDKVLFIDASNEFHSGRHQNVLQRAHIERISDVFKRFEAEHRISYIATSKEIEESQFTLNLSRYIQNEEIEDVVDFPQEVRRLRSLMAARNEAEKEMLAFLEELDCDA